VKRAARPTRVGGFEQMPVSCVYYLNPPPLCLRVAMPVNQLKLKKRLVDEFGFSEKQAEGITTAVTEADEADITRKDLGLLEARLRRLIWQQTIGIVSTLGALIAILEFVTG
jgi:hypothetical protein